MYGEVLYIEIILDLYKPNSQSINNKSTLNNELYFYILAINYPKVELEGSFI